MKGLIKPNKWIVSHFWGPEVQDQGVSGGLFSLWMVERHLFQASLSLTSWELLACGSTTPVLTQHPTCAHVSNLSLLGNSLVVQWLGLQASAAKYQSLILSLESKILQAMRRTQKQKTKKFLLSKRTLASLWLSW